MLGVTGLGAVDVGGGAGVLAAVDLVGAFVVGSGVVVAGFSGAAAVGAGTSGGGSWETGCAEGVSGCPAWVEASGVAGRGAVWAVWAVWAA